MLIKSIIIYNNRDDHDKRVGLVVFINILKSLIHLARFYFTLSVENASF